MRKTRQWKRIGMRVAAIAMAAAVVVPMFSFLGLNADAATSLSGIENIKNRGSFSILEIVPQEGTGSIGYYVKQQEPTANWLEEVAARVGKAERKSYADQLLANLKVTGLMGEVGASATDYPLVQTGPYQEYLPWETIPDDANIVEILLDKTEEQKVAATFQEDEAGDYIQANAYTYDATGGDYVENVLHYIYGRRGGAAADSTYYYCVNFTRVELTETNVTSYIGVPMYTPITSTTIPNYTYYEYAGTLEYGGDFTIDDDINEGVGYFTAALTVGHDQPKPSWECLNEVAVTAETVSSFVGKTLYVPDTDSYTAVEITEGYVPEEGIIYYELVENAHSYYAYTDPSAPYRLKTAGESGYFDLAIGYQYVGNGNAPVGSTYYQFSAGGSEQSIAYDTVFITGGYTNNDWFKRYVLDMEAASLETYRISVNSVTPDMLTETMVRNAGLVVVSAGFDRATGNPVAYTRDINAAMLTELQDKARVVDARITGAPNLLSLQDGTQAPAVTTNNVYNFACGSGTDARSALATNQFHTPFTDKTAYQVVSDEIEYENFLRDGEDELSEDISMATCIRYIINTHRTQNKKTSLRVLDIQPVAEYDGFNGPLTVSTVKSWLPQATQNLIGNNITITHMSTAALVGKIEDISEQYDLIYIGAEEVGKNLPSGMYYANIGKAEEVDGHLTGLLDSDDDGVESTARYSGNDLTPKKQRELLEFANAGMPVIVSDKLLSGGTVGSGPQLKAEIAASGSGLKASYTLTPAPVEGSNVSVEYQWQQKSRTGYNPTWQDMRDNTSEILPNPSTSTYYYRCRVIVTIDGVSRTAYTNGVRYSSSGGSSSGYYGKEFEKHTGNYSDWEIEYENQSGGGNNWWPGMGGFPGGNQSNVTYTFDIATNATSQTLEVSYNCNVDVYDEDITYRWYRIGNSSAQGYSDEYRVNNYEQYYYCVITIEYQQVRRGSWRTVTATSPAYRLVQKYIGGGSGSSGSATTVEQGITPDPFPGEVSGEITLDPTKVDPNSLMSEMLTSVWDRENVIVQSSVESSATNTNLDDNQDTLVKYLNLSRPSIEITTKPKEYGGDVTAAASYDCGGELSFTFSIKNPTDPTPLQTRYQCNLYIDQNGDGRHTAEERIGDLYIGQISGSNTAAVENGTLAAEATYTLQRTLNRTQFSGLVAWKLEVVKVGDSTAHASEKGYAYIMPAAPTVVNVLQIQHNNQSGNGVNLSTDSNFTSLYSQVAAANMYDINVSITDVSDLNDLATQEAVFALLDQHDMIVLGFYDCYDKLEDWTAKAVAQYIETGKAILFTHDTTSYWNLEESQARSVWNLVNTSNPYWGYWFNQVIRDKVGLDRYGVTNESFKTYGIDTGTDGSIVASEAQALRNAGYTPAFVPDPYTAYTSAGETQGFTNPIIEKYRTTNGTGDNKYTTTVSQANQGQITEYPYKLDKEMTVSQTHAQYYQLNMNAEDIVVWYCLGGNNYSDAVNDATNAYYIYNRGNITYSGAGHFTSNSSRLSADEARLFLNTMVAAYRAAYSKPTIEFKTGEDYPASMQLIPVEFESASASQSLSGEQNIYFKVQDTNLTANKSIAVELYYDVAEGTEGAVTDATLTVPGEGAVAPIVKKATLGKVYRVDNGAEVSATNLNSSILYRTAIPIEVLTYFANQSDSETKIYLKATTTIHNGSSNSSYSGSDDLTLKKLGLLRLE